MKNKNNTYKKTAYTISQGLRVLNHSQTEIRKLFPERPVCFMECIDYENYYFAVEIRFDTEKATLTCYFNPYGLCHHSFLLLDHRKEANDYIEYLNQTYPYNKADNRWILPGAYLEIKLEKEIYLCFIQK